MNTSPSPLVQRRRLRTELRRIRAEAHLTQEQAAYAMGWSLSKIIRIETGPVGIFTNDLRALLSLYKVRDQDRTVELIELARAARQTFWWSKYREISLIRTCLRRGMIESFLILEFSYSEDSGVLFMERSSDPIFSQGETGEIVRYRELFEHLRSISLGPASTLEYLTDLTKQNMLTKCADTAISLER